MSPRHPMQHLLPDSITATGSVPERDPIYGFTYTTVENVGYEAKMIQEEVEFDGVETDAEGYVHLTLRGTRVARAAMSDHHADAHLCIMDPIQ